MDFLEAFSCLVQDEGDRHILFWPRAGLRGRITRRPLSTHCSRSPGEFIKRIGITCVSLLALFGQQIASGQSGANEQFDVASFDATVSEMRQDANVLGMAVAVIENGQLVHVKGYGIVGPNGQAVTPQTAFQIGSITKSFVALVVLQLASEGKLNLDDPVVRHVPEFRTASKSQSDRITIDHLITHHSGLTTLDGNSYSTADPGLSGPAAAVAEMARARLFADPGTTFQYSNANYALLSHLIEVLDGRSFEQALQARIFEPLGMTNSFLHVPPSDAIAIATGYRLWFGLPIPAQSDPDAPPDRRRMGAGGIWASIEDMARYLEAVRARDPRIVPEEADRLFLVKPYSETWGYSYGWYANNGGDAPVYEHSGFTPGFLALATIVPATDQAVAVLTNKSGLAQGDLPRAVTHAALGWAPVPATAPFGARIAIWSAVTAPLGLLVLLWKTGRRLHYGRQHMRPWVRGLNVGAALGLVVGVYFLFIGFQKITGVSFPTGYAFFPDLTSTTAAAMAFALLLAAGRLALAVRGR